MYKVIKCKNCKEFQLTSAKNRYTCFKCRKSFDIKKIYFQSETPYQSQEVIKRIKEEYAKQNLDFEEGFK